MYSLFCTQGCQSGLGKGSALGLAACAALQGLLVGRKGLGRCRRGQVDARQDGGVEDATGKWSIPVGDVYAVYEGDEMLPTKEEMEEYASKNNYTFTDLSAK